ncbi:predicted protein [Histoplasma capsulatum H143]|uniref:Uncharacterized protein n=1 Tax=Ajellomyces capsulatus (strain H143) TaxID=544712 RepID=C6HQV6_AJECH|nr:predicted protein [Histoplasma capsulatum H143]
MRCNATITNPSIEEYEGELILLPHSRGSLRRSPTNGLYKGSARLETNPNRPLLVNRHTMQNRWREQLLALEYRVRINEGLNIHATNGLAPGLLEEHTVRD